MSSVPRPDGYPGNPSLPREVRDKILSTFRHTLNLFKEGKTDDCVIGCDFILKMDPRFSPARQLMEKARNPAAAVSVAELESVVAETPTRQQRVASVDADRLLVRAVESFNAREFDAAIAAAEQVLSVLPGNQHAQAVLQKAKQKKSAQPAFDAARQSAIAALDARKPGEARAALERMRSLDPEHPAVSLLERRLGQAQPSPAGTPEVVEVGESTNPGIGSSKAAPEPMGADAGGLGDLSLDSLSLDDPLDSPAAVPPPPNFEREKTGPLSISSQAEALGLDAGLGSSAPPNFWSDAPAEEPATPEPPSPTFSAPPPRAAPEPPPGPSPEQEIASLLAKGDEASRAGNRQQAIEIWSRIFLIDINNSEAVGRIEKARQEMAEGNRRVAENLKQGRESFEAGDLTRAREAFLAVLALDENDQTARSYLDRIESQLSRPSTGADLSKKAAAGDVLADAMAEAAESQASELEADEAEPARPVSAAKPARRPRDIRFLAALGGAALIALIVGGYFLLRPSRPARPGSEASANGPSLEHATALFREGKLTETVAELRQIPAGHPDYARAQKLLASLTRKEDSGAAQPSGAPAEKPIAAAPSGPAPEAVARRQEAERALSEKRYIDALKGFNLAAPAFGEDPTFSQAMGAASEKVNEITPAVKLYNEGEFDTAIPILWRIYQADRGNQDARSYLLRSYYNQGIGQLQNGLYPKASDSFKEVLAIDPSDADAIRHKKFAERYLKGDLDLMGRIYVRHVQQRP
jgi:tetratricopeptide (TPR) repeat protein